MRTFLSKYMSAEALDELENAYKNANAGATGLPVYIPKSRFDEENTKRKNAEQLVAGFEEDKKKAVREAVEKYKDIPDDWKQLMRLRHRKRIMKQNLQQQSRKPT